MAEQFKLAEEALEDPELRELLRKELLEFKRDKKTEELLKAFSTPIQDGTMQKIVP